MPVTPTIAEEMPGEAERAELRETVNRLLRDRCSEADVRRVMEEPAGYDQGLWRDLCEMGLPALALPTEHGGLGYGWAELAVVLEEMGSFLYPGPFLSSTLAAAAVVELATPQAQAALLPGLADGTSLLAFAASALYPATPAVAVSSGRGGLTASGELPVVLDVQNADALLVLTMTADGVRLLSLDPAADGVLVTPLLGMDLTRRLARVDLANAPVADITRAEADSRDVDRWVALALTARAAEQIGGARRALDDTVAYVKTRMQFGRAVGSFQAVKHRCADLAVDLAEAEAARAAAVESAAAGTPDLLLARLAASTCADAYLGIARAMVQLHGGVGFTWEHSAHLHLKRAKTSQLLGGSPAVLRRLLGEQLGLRYADTVG